MIFVYCFFINSFYRRMRDFYGKTFIERHFIERNFIERNFIERHFYGESF